MDFKKKTLIVLMILSVFLLSSCEVYQTLYGTTGKVVQNQTMEEKPEEAAPAEAEEVQPAEEEAEVPQEVTEEKPKEKPFVVVVQETDLVDLIPKAEDPDADTKLTFTFTSPVSDNGEWQTTYGDAGEYTVTVTVSDGLATDSRDVLIIVNKKEEPPEIELARPIESALTIDETDSLEFSVKASDLNNDPLTYTWKLDGVEVATEDQYTYQTDYDSAGTHTVKVDVSDSFSIATRIWSVEVRNVNRKPVVEELGDIQAKETDLIKIIVLAADDDQDPLTYSISDSRFVQDNNELTWQTDYDSAGTFEVTVSASDGQDTTSQTLTINVENVNRPPVIVDVLQKQ